MTIREQVSKVGTRVQWKREVYGRPYDKRPIDHGVVVAVDGYFLTVKDDATGDEVRGNWAVFLPEAAADV